MKKPVWTKSNTGGRESNRIIPNANEKNPIQAELRGESGKSVLTGSRIGEEKPKHAMP